MHAPQPCFAQLGGVHNNLTTFLFLCTYICYSIQLTDALNTSFRLKWVLFTHFGQFAPDKSFYKKVVYFSILETIQFDSKQQ